MGTETGVEKRLATLLTLLLLWTAWLPGSARGAETKEVSFDGGPAGGTYLVFAEGLAELLNRKMPAVRITVNPSGGSIANLIRLDTGKIDMALASASDIELGKNGRLKEYSVSFKGVRAVARLFDEYAHLAVLENSSIRTLADLKGKRVAVGTRGSGTFAAARRFFRSVGMWEEIKPEYASFDLVVKDFLSGQVEAVWQIDGYPSASLKEICRHTSLRLIDLSKAADGSDFYSEHPYYSPGTIPAGAYSCVDAEAETFRDQAVWVASKKVKDQIVFEALSHIFSAEGLKEMQNVHPTGRELDPDKAARDLAIPFHPGAKRYWESQQ
jgi:TRAP transporter TAXI family solute receptor